MMILSWYVLQQLVVKAVLGAQLIQRTTETRRPALIARVALSSAVEAASVSHSSEHCVPSHVKLHILMQRVARK